MAISMYSASVPVFTRMLSNLSHFLDKAEASLVMINVSKRIKYQDIPKFIIYAMQTQVVSKHGEKPSIPFLVLAKQDIRFPPDNLYSKQGEDDVA